MANCNINDVTLKDESSDLDESCQQEGFEDDSSNNSDDYEDYDDEEVQVIDGQKLFEQTGK